jgi:hypothetical protein
MPPLRRRPLRHAAMVGGAGHLVSTPSATVDPVEDAASKANRIDALTKLRALYVSGVLTEEQYASEHARLIGGI